MITPTCVLHSRSFDPGHPLHKTPFHGIVERELTGGRVNHTPVGVFPD